MKGASPALTPASLPQLLPRPLGPASPAPPPRHAARSAPPQVHQTEKSVNMPGKASAKGKVAAKGGVKKERKASRAAPALEAR